MGMLMTRVLVTGHRGFVGRHFTDKFSDLGYDIRGVDIKGTLGRDVRDFFRKDGSRFDLVVHLAAVVGGRTKIEGQPLEVATDLSIDAEMFNWAMRTRPKQLIYFSSSAAYPIIKQGLAPGALGTKLKESDIKLDAIENPDQTYGWAKLTGEMLAEHAKADGLNVKVFRPFSGYGSDQDLDYPFPSFIDRAKSRENPFDIWGDGKQVRDFIHIDDIVDATISMLDESLPGPVNLCTGRDVSFNELATYVCDMTNHFPQFKHHIDKPVGVRYRVGSPELMNTFYTPKISLEEGIYRALQE